MPHEFKVGDELYVVPNGRLGRKAFSETITKVGRRWLAVGYGRSAIRFDRETLRSDPGRYTSVYTAYKSKAEYEAHQKLLSHWERLRVCLNRLYTMPEGMTHRVMDEVARLLGLTLAGEEA